jgi:hypothetical protein
VKERAITFSAPMILAYKAKRKHQTRRLMKPQPTSQPDPEGTLHVWNPRMEGRGGVITWTDAALFRRQELIVTFCPFGLVGDRLYFREAWRTLAKWDDLSPAKLPADPFVQYEADGWRNQDLFESLGRYRHARFMPRALSRFSVEITEVRAERLDQISEEDAQAEGAMFHDGRPIGHHGWRHTPDGDVWGTARESFQCLWKQLHGPDSWGPHWVWAVSFKQVEL